MYLTLKLDYFFQQTSSIKHKFLLKNLLCLQISMFLNKTYFLIFLILIFFITITVTPNHYPWLVTFYIFLLIIFIIYL